MRIGELILDFLPGGHETHVRPISEMDAQGLEDWVWATLDSRRGSPHRFAEAQARGQDDKDGWIGVWEWSPLVSFVDKCRLPDSDKVDEMREAFSRIAFLRAVLPQEITWEDVTIC